jgi:hypothetical protein
VIRTRPLLGALVTAAVAVFMLAAYGGSSEGTVVAKTDKGVYDYACQTGATVTGPVAVPVWGCAPSQSAGGWSSATSTEPRSKHASAARSTTACNWARTGMDGPTSEPPGLVTGHRLLERPACADCRQVLGALDVAASV